MKSRKGIGEPPNRPSGRRHQCAVRAFCRRQNLGAGGIHRTAVGGFAALRMWRTPCGCFRRAFISNGVPAGRQPCGAVLPWSTWAMMATFLKCSFCIYYLLLFRCQSHARSARHRSKGLPGPQRRSRRPGTPSGPRSGGPVRIRTQFCIICRRRIFCKPSRPVFSKKWPDSAFFRDKRRFGSFRAPVFGIFPFSREVIPLQKVSLLSAGFLWLPAIDAPAAPHL